MKIVKLKAENVKRLEAVEIVPDGEIVEIRGKNAQGKSSVLDSIAYAIGGKRLCPEHPIRKGQKAASVMVDLEDLVVVRTWSGKGSTLRIKDKDGATVSSPQTILDKLAGYLTFDPLAFLNLKPDKQRERLLDLLDIGPQLDKLAEERDRIYANRTKWNEISRQANAELEGISPVPADTPDSVVRVSDLMDELREAEDVNRENARQRECLRSWEEKRKEKDREMGRADARVEEVKKQLAAAEAYRDGVLAEIAQFQAQIDRYKEPIEALEDVDVSPITEKIEAVSEINQSVARKKRREELVSKATKANEQADKHTDYLNDLDDRREDLLKSADFPVEGLGFDDDGVTFNNLPLDQASQAERLRVSLGIAMAMNPDLRVLLIRDGSLLDDDSMKLICEAVKDRGYQLWIERVGEEGGPSAVVIEDGHVKTKGEASDG